MRALFIILLAAYSWSASGQSVKKCGYSYIQDEIITKHPRVTDPVEHIVAKITHDNHEHYTIPVVFHIVLNQAQQNALGGEAGIRRFIDSQMAVINRDFNAQNPDSTKIPPAFKPLYGNAGIRFELARTAPDGSATDGYQLLTTAASGFNLSNGKQGSRQAFSDSKYRASGGLEAWDPSVYINIWVINALDNSTTTDILGLTLSPTLIQDYAMPFGETGITLNYRAWNTLLNFRGRTLTHELGHFFELRHVWGDDEGRCPATDGEDDGIDDTPIQAYETYGCPAFPKIDGCTREAPGIMFMNYMDYTSDNCQHLFTKGQVEKMRSFIQPFAISHSLTQHSEVLKPPTGAAANTYVIYPNPAQGKVNIRFNRTSEGLKFIRIMNMMGQTIIAEPIQIQKGFYFYDLSHLGNGIYFLQLEFGNETKMERVVLQ